MNKKGLGPEKALKGTEADQASSSLAVHSISSHILLPAFLQEELTWGGPASIPMRDVCPT